MLDLPTLAASLGFAPRPTGSKPGVLRVTPRGSELVEPEVVATSPYRIKSPVPVCCGFGSVKMVLATGVAPALATPSTSCLCFWTTRANKREPPAGDAPAGILYKRNPQAAAWRQKWSQSPVPPRTQRAYETCLSTGSTAVMAVSRQSGVPSRILTGNLALRTRLLCALSYRDDNQTPGRSLPPAKSPRMEAAGAASRSGVRNGAGVRGGERVIELPASLSPD
jgi:hypothetical protein